MSERVRVRVKVGDVADKAKGRLEDIIRRAIEREQGDPRRAARAAVDDIRRSMDKVNVHGHTT